MTPRLFGCWLGVGFLASALAAEEPGERTRRQLWVNPDPYVECTSDTAFYRGQVLMLTGDGLAPNEPVQILLSQQDVQLTLPPARADKDGSLSARILVPANAVPGQEAELRALGAGVMLVSPPLHIFADARDSDGDGFPDMCDTCPNAASPDLTDSDYDQIGDACDACPQDPENDADKDGLCGDVDPNPFEPVAHSP